MSKKQKEHPILNYPRVPGKCPKCNHRSGYQPQLSTMPPGEHCPICGWHDFEMAAMVMPDFDALPDNRRPA